MTNGHYKPMTASDVHSALLGLIESGEIVPVWSVEQSDVAFWPANEAPPDAELLSTEQVRNHFVKIIEELTK